jgi:uncharacterized protein YegJ (DUF2314 family)
MQAGVNALVFLLLFSSGCSRRDEPAHAVKTDSASTVSATKSQLPAPSSALRAAPIGATFAVYHLSRPTIAPLALIRSLARKSALEVADAFPPTVPAKPLIIIRTPKITEAPPPGLEELRYRGRGLSKSDQERLQRADSLTTVTFIPPPTDGTHTYRATVALVLELARRTDGVVWDTAARRAFSASEFAKLLEGWSGDIPDVSRHITIDMYRDGDLTRVVSLGMEKLGLPDLVVSDVAVHDSGTMSVLVTVVLQTMLERGALDRPGELTVALARIRNEAFRKSAAADRKAKATGVATVYLAVATPAQGDADNRLFEIVFPGPPDTLQVRQNELLSRFFGAEDSVTSAKADDPELLAASRRAKQALAKMKPLVTPKPPPLEHLIVKAPFATPGGGTEWMWVEVVRWEGTKISGILENDPDQVRDLKAGARVEVEESSLFDYILRRRDGTLEGNETGKILQAREKQ